MTTTHSEPPGLFGGAQWITSPAPFGVRPQVRPDELGAWIWAPPPLAEGAFELYVDFQAPDRGVVYAWVVGAARSGTTPALLSINGVRGFAGGEVQTFGPEYPCFEGDLSTWIRPGTNRLSVRVQGPAEQPGIALKLAIAYADWSASEVATDQAWRARPVDSNGPDRPAAVVAACGSDDGVPRRKLFTAPWPAPQMRREFEVSGEVRRAMLHVCGLGCHEAYLNGRKVGDHVLDPAQTNYDKRAFYVTHHVTDLLRPGANTVGIVLGHGWYAQDRAWCPAPMVYGKPAAIARLEVELADGRVAAVETDSAWRAGEGPLRQDSLYVGEEYDARLETPGWSEPGFDDSAWPAVEVVPPLAPRLEPQRIPPMRRTGEVRPVALSQPKPGLWVFDLGANVAGWARLRVTEEPGTVVQMRFGEALKPDGTVDYRSTGVAATRCIQRDDYICRGDGPETYEPRFTYHGFQYVEVSGLRVPPTLDTITGVTVHTDLQPAGEFESGDSTLNLIERLSRRSLLANVHGIVTDCPHRERCQWHADAEIIADYALYSFDAAGLFAKACDDYATNLDESGLPKEIGVGRRSWSVHDFGWGTFIIQVPWRIFQYRGDDAPLRRHYDLMRRFLDHWLAAHPDGVIPGASYGDHAPPTHDHAGNDIAPCPKDGYATTLLYEAAATLARIGAHLGRPEDERTYAAAAGHVRTAILDRFYDASAGGYAHPTLDAYALLLGLYPDGRGDRLAAHFAADLEARGHMNVGGFFGYRRIAEAAILRLPESVALDVLTQDREPGLPYSVSKQGATSVWERFLTAAHKDFGEISLNHFAYGSVSELFWRHLAGIQPAEPGFGRVRLAPRLTGVIPWVAATYDSPHGPIRSSWRRDGDAFTWDVELPPGTSATATTPDGAEQELGPGRHRVAG